MGNSLTCLIGNGNEKDNQEALETWVRKELRKFPDDIGDPIDYLYARFIIFWIICFFTKNSNLTIKIIHQVSWIMRNSTLLIPRRNHPNVIRQFLIHYVFKKRLLWFLMNWCRIYIPFEVFWGGAKIFVTCVLKWKILIMKRRIYSVITIKLNLIFS